MYYSSIPVTSVQTYRQHTTYRFAIQSNRIVASFDLTDPVQLAVRNDETTELLRATRSYTLSKVIKHLTFARSALVLLLQHDLLCGGLATTFSALFSTNRSSFGALNSWRNGEGVARRKEAIL